MPDKRPNRAERHLLTLFRGMSAADRDSLLAFAEFLAARGEGEESEDLPAEPVLIQGPPDESVIAAIKRLSASYPMLDRAALLNEASALMSAHLMQGRPASEVIAELETLFVSHYEAFKGAGGSPE